MRQSKTISTKKSRNEAVVGSIWWMLPIKSQSIYLNIKATLFARLSLQAPMNFGKIRIQFHAVTDDHEQLRTALDAFNMTVEKYGQHPTELVTTDKPGCNKNFLMATLAPVSNRAETL
jgi:hypothetical protein